MQLKDVTASHWHPSTAAVFRDPGGDSRRDAWKALQLGSLSSVLGFEFLGCIGSYHMACCFGWFKGAAASF